MGLDKYKFNIGDIFPAENADSIDPDNLIPQAGAILTGGTTPSTMLVFDTLGQGANTGKFKINIDGTVYDNVAVDLSGLRTTLRTLEDTYNADTTINNTVRVFQSFTTSPRHKNLNGGQLKIYGARVSGGEWDFFIDLYLADANGKPTGSAIFSQSIGIGSSEAWYPINVPANTNLTPSTKYCIVVRNNAGSSARIAYATTGDIANGNYGSSSDSGSTWTVDTNKDLLIDFTETVVKEYSDLATLVQTAIRAETSKLETCVWSTNKFIIRGDNPTRTGSILKLMTPTTGTDISGVNATRYLDLGTNATETEGTGDEYMLMRVNKWGSVPIGKPFKTFTWANTTQTEVFNIPAGVKQVILKYKGEALETNSFLRLTVNAIAGTNYAHRYSSSTSLSSGNAYWTLMTQNSANNPMGQGELKINVEPAYGRIFCYGIGEIVGGILFGGYVITGDNASYLTFSTWTRINAVVEIYLI